jgi:hypothetical protein
MIEFLTGMGVVLAYQKRDKWIPIVKKQFSNLTNKIFGGGENGSSIKKEKDQKEFDFNLKEGDL